MIGFAHDSKSCNVRGVKVGLIRPDGILQRKYLISLFYGDVENFKKSENKNYDDL